MYGVVKIGDKEVPMLATASVDIYYKRVFREDPLSVMTSKTADDGTKTRVAFGMGFIMAKFAELKDRRRMMELNEDAYIEWLDQFDYGDFVSATSDIIGIYYGQRFSTAKEKKETRP